MTQTNRLRFGGVFNADSDGFVLPYVLATVAILSLIAVMGANTLREAQQNLQRLERHDALSGSLDDAEAVAIDAFLTSTFTKGGIFLGQRAPGNDADIALGMSDSDEVLPEELTWDARGGRRVVPADGATVVVEYQDAGGLVSLYSGDAKLVTRLLASVMGNQTEAAQLAAKLGDFTDADDTRRFTGGERADYRMARLRPPSNSPVRSWEELGEVMGWAQQPFYRSRSILKYMTFFYGPPSPRTAGMPAELAAMLVEDTRRVRAEEDMLVSEPLVDSAYPTPAARFTLTAVSPDGAFGLRRVIEAERTAGAPDFAISRRLIAEYLIAPEDIENLNLDALPALAVPTPGRPQQ